MLNRGDVEYLSYMTTEANLTSILRHGILSHNRVAALTHESVADADVQRIRSDKTCGGRPLHDYVNLYFWPRNAMMYRVKSNEGLCIIRVSLAVLDLPGVYYSSRNAAVGGATFHEVAGHEFPPLTSEQVYSRYWSSDGVSDANIKEVMQAEVLVPDVVEPNRIERIYARSKNQASRISRLCPDIQVQVDSNLFFE